MCDSDIAIRAGLSHDTIKDWRFRSTPNIVNLEAALNVLGYRLSVKRILESEKVENKMGLYVDPKHMTKKEWLEQYGLIITFQEAQSHKYGQGKTFIVCLVDNGSFTAAAILDCFREFEKFTQLEDYRPKIFYKVPMKELDKLPFSSTTITAIRKNA